MNILIRPAKENDFESIFQLLKQLWPDNRLNFEKTGAVFIKNLSVNYKRLLCAEFEDRIIGFCSLTIKDNLWQQGLLGNVDELVVDEKFRGKGVGNLLMQEITDIARNEGCKQLELESSFHRTEAHEFYKKLGFSTRAFLFTKSIEK